jgi:hypothetical protein
MRTILPLFSCSTASLLAYRSRGRRPTSLQPYLLPARVFYLLTRVCRRLAGTSLSPRTQLLDLSVSCHLREAARRRARCVLLLISWGFHLRMTISGCLR